VNDVIQFPIVVKAFEPKVEEEPESDQRTIRLIEYHLKRISAAYNPETRREPLTQAIWNFSDYFYNHILAVCTDDCSKTELLSSFSRMKDHYGILLEITAKDKPTSHTDIGNYNVQTFSLQSVAQEGYQKQLISLSAPAKKEVEESLCGIGKPGSQAGVEAEYALQNPIINAMLGLPHSDFCKREYARGRFPFLVVDANPQQTELNPKETYDRYIAQETRDNLYNSLFHLANCTFAEDISRLIVQQAVPVVYLMSHSEIRTAFAIRHIFNTFHEATADRFFLGSLKDAPLK